MLFMLSFSAVFKEGIGFAACEKGNFFFKKDRARPDFLWICCRQLTQ
jgi:hypothetical protein